MYPVAHGDSILEQVHISRRKCTLWRTHAGAGEMCEEEVAAEKTRYVLTMKPHSPSSWPPSAGQKEEELLSEGVEKKQGKYV